MIRIFRPDTSPKRLEAGTVLVTELNKSLAERPNVAGQKEEPLAFDKTIYGHKSVKNALRKAQHGKCAYCEADFAGNSSGDVEHFRPKAYSQQSAGSAKLYPGYYWLAYAWSNLLYSCELCNRRVKRNLFPLKNAANRARCPEDNLAAEEPLLIDPAGLKDPRDHIRFRRNKPYGITDEGRATVRVMDLDRPELDESRLRHIKLIETLRYLASLEPTDQSYSPDLTLYVQKARKELAELVKPTAPFSALTIDLLAD